MPPGRSAAAPGHGRGGQPAPRCPWRGSQAGLPGSRRIAVVPDQRRPLPQAASAPRSWCCPGGSLTHRWTSAIVPASRGWPETVKPTVGSRDHGHIGSAHQNSPTEAGLPEPRAAVGSCPHQDSVDSRVGRRQGGVRWRRLCGPTNERFLLVARRISRRKQIQAPQEAGFLLPLAALEHHAYSLIWSKGG